MLNGLGYNLTVNTTFDEATAAAVKDFQTKNALEVTGVVEEKTNTAMQVQLLAQLQANDPVIEKAVTTLTDK